MKFFLVLSYRFSVLLSDSSAKSAVGVILGLKLSRSLWSRMFFGTLSLDARLGVLEVLKKTGKVQRVAIQDCNGNILGPLFLVFTQCLFRKRFDCGVGPFYDLDCLCMFCCRSLQIYAEFFRYFVYNLGDENASLVCFDECGWRSVSCRDVYNDFSCVCCRGNGKWISKCLSRKYARCCNDVLVTST